MYPSMRATRRTRVRGKCATKNYSVVFPLYNVSITRVSACLCCVDHYDCRQTTRQTRDRPISSNSAFRIAPDTHCYSISCAICPTHISHKDQPHGVVCVCHHPSADHLDTAWRAQEQGRHPVRCCVGADMCPHALQPRVNASAIKNDSVRRVFVMSVRPRSGSRRLRTCLHRHTQVDLGEELAIKGSRIVDELFAAVRVWWSARTTTV